MTMNNDTLKWTFTGSIVIHLFLVLGISFVMPSTANKEFTSPPLKITLVNNISEIAPEDADILAQSNSLEGTDEPENQPQIVNIPAQASLASTDTSELLLTQDEGVMNTYPTTEPTKENQSTATREELTSAILLAQLNAEANPREKYVTSRAKEDKHAAYIEKWRQSVEKIGNLNYPEAAKEQQISGDLVLDVAINSDGSVRDIRVLRSSDLKILDDAAERIVDLAAPFESFPAEFRNELDVLHIVRTWEFKHNTLASKSIY